MINKFEDTTAGPVVVSSHSISNTGALPSISKKNLTNLVNVTNFTELTNIISLTNIEKAVEDQLGFRGSSFLFFQTNDLVWAQHYDMESDPYKVKQWQEAKKISLLFSAQWSPITGIYGVSVQTRVFWDGFAGVAADSRTNIYLTGTWGVEW